MKTYPIKFTCSSFCLIFSGRARRELVLILDWRFLSVIGFAPKRIKSNQFIIENQIVLKASRKQTPSLLVVKKQSRPTNFDAVSAVNLQKFVTQHYYKSSSKMKANQPLTINKKLILHFDIEGVLRLPEPGNKDFYVYNLCAAWVWGKLEKNSKEDASKVTGWKLVSNALSKEQPEPECVTYKEYLEQHVRPDAKEYENLVLNLSKGPAAKAKSEIEKTIKNITVPKLLLDALRQNKQPVSELERKYSATGKYEILPAFYKLILNLKKNKREFAIVVRSTDPKLNHSEVINELNAFFLGQHPLYNGKNGTALVKLDGTNKSKNFVFADSHFSVVYVVNPEAQPKELIASFGTSTYFDDKDPDMLKQSLKSSKKIKVCQKSGQIYAYLHSILAQSAFIYEINKHRVMVIDQVDYLTHEVYFTTSSKHSQVYSALGDLIDKRQSFVEQVDLFELLRDIDYFIKKVQRKQQARSQEINKIEKGQEKETAPNEQEPQQPQARHTEADDEYLKRTILPLLDGAFRKVDLIRPQDPIGYIALYCLKNKQRID